MRRLKIQKEPKEPKEPKEARAASAPPGPRPVVGPDGFDWTKKEHVNRLFLLVDGFHDFTDVSEIRSNAYAKQLYLHTKMMDFPGFPPNTTVDTILRTFLPRTSHIEKDFTKLLELHCPHMFSVQTTKLLQLSIRKIHTIDEFTKGYGQFYIQKQRDAGERLLQNVLTRLVGESYTFTTDASPGLTLLQSARIQGVDLRTRRLDSARKEVLNAKDTNDAEHIYTTHNLSRGLLKLRVLGKLSTDTAQIEGYEMIDPRSTFLKPIQDPISKGPSLGYLAWLISNPLLLKLLLDGKGATKHTKQMIQDAGHTQGQDTWNIANILPDLQGVFAKNNYERIQRILYDFKTFGDAEPSLEAK